MKQTPHRGLPHWWAMKITSLALIPLGLWLVYGLMTNAGLEQVRVQAWLGNPINSVVLALFLLFGLHHSAYGLQVVIEDYVHTPWKKRSALMAVTLSHLIAAGLGLFALIACALRT